MSSNPDPLETTPELVHSHSDMTRQLDELESHAQTLKLAEEFDSSIFDDLLTFARQFGAEMTEHISIEEATIFPPPHRLHSLPVRTTLLRIRSQHRDLEDSFNRLMSFLAAAEKAQKAGKRVDDDLLESIHIRTRILRYAFLVHSQEEENFLAETTSLEDT